MRRTRRVYARCRATALGADSGRPVLLRDSPLTDELRTRQDVAPCVADDADGWRGLGELPARCLVTAGDALQKHAILLELQQRVMAVDATEHLPHPIQHACTEPIFLLNHVDGNVGGRNPAGIVGFHDSCSSRDPAPSYSRTLPGRSAVQVISRGVPG